MTKFLKGAEGWYFLNNDSNQVIDEITGANKLSQAYATEWGVRFTARQAKADKLGAKLVTFIVPNKHCIYPQYLPENIKISDQRLALLGDFDGLQSVIYDTELFSDPDTFHKNDTHWTDYGAYIAFMRIMAEFNLEPLNTYPQESFNREYCKGDLTGANGKKKELVLKTEHKIEETYDNGIVHVGRVRIYENKKLKDSKKGKKLAVFGGSSTKQIIDFLAHEFEVVVHVWTQSIDWEVVKEHGCDYVLALPGERFMVKVATDNAHWEYKQGNALKYLKGTAYLSLNAKGISDYFGHLGYQNAIELLASSLSNLIVANEPTTLAVASIVHNLDRSHVDALIEKLVTLGVDKALLESLRYQSLSKEIGLLSKSGRDRLKSRFNVNIQEILNADILRDSAILLEKQDVSKAQYLMGLAAIKRPDGSVIVEKLLSYEKEIKNA